MFVGHLDEVMMLTFLHAPVSVTPPFPFLLTCLMSHLGAKRQWKQKLCGDCEKHHCALRVFYLVFENMVYWNTEDQWSQRWLAFENPVFTTSRNPWWDINLRINCCCGLQLINKSNVPKRDENLGGHLATPQSSECPTLADGKTHIQPVCAPRWATHKVCPLNGGLGNSLDIWPLFCSSLGLASLCNQFYSRCCGVGV